MIDKDISPVEVSDFLFRFAMYLSHQIEEGEGPIELDPELATKAIPLLKDAGWRTRKGYDWQAGIRSQIPTRGRTPKTIAESMTLLRCYQRLVKACRAPDSNLRSLVEEIRRELSFLLWFLDVKAPDQKQWLYARDPEEYKRYTKKPDLQPIIEAIPIQRRKSCKGT